MGKREKSHPKDGRRAPRAQNRVAIQRTPSSGKEKRNKKENKE